MSLFGIFVPFTDNSRSGAPGLSCSMAFITASHFFHKTEFTSYMFVSTAKTAGTETLKSLYPAILLAQHQ